MSVTNRGAILTKKFLEASGKRQVDLARACEVSSVTALNWLRCSMKPRAPRRKAIAKWSKGAIPVESWDEPAAARTARAA